MHHTKDIKVLIAEDDFLVCEEIIRVIKKIGYQHIGSATNGEKAVQMTCSLRPDVILMDLQMPKMDGITAAKKIQEKCPTPVIVLTAHDSREYIEKAGASGVGAFITKPPRADDIERAVTIAIARHSDFMELAKLNQQLEKELTNRQAAEEKLKLLLKEKEVLLKEIHHRVKNNFMVISSLLNLQSLHIKDDEAREIFKESYNRVNSMALIHERLYQTSDVTKVDFANYLKNLTNGLLQSYSVNQTNIKLITNVANFSLDINLAIPCGLIVNELVSNALKHGFPDNNKKFGIIEIQMHPVNNFIELIVKDNGVGMPDAFNIDQSKSLGMQLVKILAEGQLNGKIDIESNQGTLVKITFQYHNQDS